jgi:hypothetical protein
MNIQSNELHNIDIYDISLNSPWPKFEKINYLLVYSKFCNSLLGLHRMFFFPWDSLEGFLKLPNNYELLLELIRFSFSFNSKVLHYNLVTFKKEIFHDILSLSFETNLTSKHQLVVRNHFNNLTFDSSNEHNLCYNSKNLGNATSFYYYFLRTLQLF